LAEYIFHLQAFGFSLFHQKLMTIKKAFFLSSTLTGFKCATHRLSGIDRREKQIRFSAIGRLELSGIEVDGLNLEISHLLF
jgi:hypothetical protein